MLNFALGVYEISVIFSFLWVLFYLVSGMDQINWSMKWLKDCYDNLPCTTVKILYLGCLSFFIAMIPFYNVVVTFLSLKSYLTHID